MQILKRHVIVQVKIVVVNFTLLSKNKQIRAITSHQFDYLWKDTVDIGGGECVKITTATQITWNVMVAIWNLSFGWASKNIEYKTPTKFVSLSIFLNESITLISEKFPNLVWWLVTKSLLAFRNISKNPSNVSKFKIHENLTSNISWSIYFWKLATCWISNQIIQTG